MHNCLFLFESEFQNTVVQGTIITTHPAAFPTSGIIFPFGNISNLHLYQVLLEEVFHHSSLPAGPRGGQGMQAEPVHLGISFWVMGEAER